MLKHAPLLLAMVIVVSDGVSAGPPRVIPLDLSRGTLKQTNCKTPVGCGHSQVSITATNWTSASTNQSPVQHILTLDLPMPPPGDLKGGRHVLELEYELANPSGHANNQICAVIDHRRGAEGRCARGVDSSGRLRVPIGQAPQSISLRFGLMPFSGAHRFAIRNVAITQGGADAEEDEEVERRVPVRLSGGRLRQAGCATPIGCQHSKVTLDDHVFSSSVPIAGPPPPPSDNPNEPPPPQLKPKRLSLELPIQDRGRGRRSLHFSYRLDHPHAQSPGRILFTAMAGESVLQSSIDVNGAGEGAFELPAGTPRMESLSIAFEPAGGGSGTSYFEVSRVSFGRGGPSSGDALPIEESTVCVTCDPPASRIDPCGPELVTFWVESADGRIGRGIRCVSRDLTAWYGEGWWNDFDYGWYRHIGYVHERRFSLPSAAYAADLGVRMTIGEGSAAQTVSYGGEGLAQVRMQWLSLDRLRVTTAGGSWNEIWQLVPDGDLLPGFFGPRPWDHRCGNFGLANFSATQYHFQFRRCAIPLDLLMSPPIEHASTPLVWLGEGRIEERSGGAAMAGMHLGWQLFAPDSGSPGIYAAADLCPSDHPAGCRTIDTITMKVNGPGEPPDVSSPEYFWWISDHHDRAGLYVLGPGIWHRVFEGVRWGHAWVPRGGELGSLPLPTPVCLEADCP